MTESMKNTITGSLITALFAVVGTGIFYYFDQKKEETEKYHQLKERVLKLEYENKQLTKDFEKIYYNGAYMLNPSRKQQKRNQQKSTQID